MKMIKSKQQEKEEHDAYIYSTGWDAGFKAAINILRIHFFKQMKQEAKSHV